MTPRSRLSVEEVAWVIAAFLAGATQWQICVALNRDPRTIRGALKRTGVRSPHARLTPRQKHELLRRRRLNPREPVAVMARLLGITEDSARRFLDRALPRSVEDRRKAQGTPTKYAIGECGRRTRQRREPTQYRCPCGNRSTEPLCIACRKKHAA